MMACEPGSSFFRRISTGWQNMISKALNDAIDNADDVDDMNDEDIGAYIEAIANDPTSKPTRKGKAVVTDSDADANVADDDDKRTTRRNRNGRRRFSFNPFRVSKHKMQKAKSSPVLMCSN